MSNSIYDDAEESIKPYFHRDHTFIEKYIRELSPTIYGCLRIVGAPGERVVVVALIIVGPVDDSDLDPVDSVDPSVEPVPTIVDPVLDPALLVDPTDQYPAVEAP